MIDKLARMARPARRAAALVAVTGLVIAFDATTGTAEGDGREPGAEPGQASDTAAAPIASDDGRTGEIVLVQPTTRSSDPVVLDNGRGGPDPAAGPNAVERESVVSVGDAGDVDTDSGAEPAVGNSIVDSSTRTRPVDEDIPGISLRVRPPSVSVDAAPVDRDG